MNTKTLLLCCASAMFMSACSIDESHEVPALPGDNMVTLNLSVDGWRDAATRADAEELLTSVTLLLVPQEGSAVVKRKVVEDDDFSIEVPSGEYEVFAVCGLPDDVVPDDLFDEIEVPLSTKGKGLADFAVGSALVSNEYGKLSSSSVSIAAKRQMAWLTVKISDIPASFTEIALYVKGAGETYYLADGWNVSEEGQNQFTNCNLARRAGKNYASVDNICIPCADSKNGTEFRIVAKTDENKTLTYKYTSTTPLIAGKQLIFNLSVSDLSLVSGLIDIPDWDSTTETATLTNPTVEKPRFL